MTSRLNLRQLEAFRATGWRSGTLVEPVVDPATKRIVGRIVFMSSRDFDNDPQTSAMGHDIPAEFLTGLFHDEWYWGDRTAQYSGLHNFRTRTLICEFPGNSLGVDENGQPWRRGYWDIRALWGVSRAANQFGREVLTPDYGEETADWFIRSGLR